MRSKLTYGHIFKASLSMLFMLVFICSKADNTQTLTNLTLQTITSGAGDAASSIAYNPTKNEYFVVYSDFDAGCASKQKLYGANINAITGIQIGSSFPISACDKKAVDPQVIYNSKQNEYAIAYKSVEGAGAKILVQIVDASNNSLKQSIELASISLGDPFESNAIQFSPTVNIYTVGYHEIISAADTKLKIKYINSLTKAVAGYNTLIDKNSFAPQNEGLKHAKLLSFNGTILICFELKLNSGSEIWGGFFNPASGLIGSSYFQISPSPAVDNAYINPSPALNSATNEIVVVYEKSHLQITTASLNEKIRAQKINSSTGVRISPMDVPITNLPAGLNPNEDAKFPSVVFSPLSDEFIVFFYGEKWINADNNFYDAFMQRIKASDLTPIGLESTLVIEDIGTAIVNNNSLRRLAFAHNSINNQFLLGWNTQTGNNVQTQVWRYDNNLPRNLAVAGTSKNENIPIGTTFTTLTATDPDPEDTNLTFSFESGVGGEDNSYFTISGNAIKVAKNLNYEEAPTRRIKVKATDTHGKSTELSVVLNINNLNETPTNLALSGTLSVAENTPAGTFTSTISVQDEDIGDTHTYSLVAGDSADNNSNFSIEPGTNVLKLIKELNYEATPKQFVRIMATDNGGRTTAKGFVIQVIDVNEQPEDLELSTNTFPENDLNTMALVEVIDPDFNSNYLAAMTSGAGDDDNNLFTVQDNQLKPLVPLNFEAKSNYTVRLKAFDGTFTTSKAFAISVADENDAPDSIRLSEFRIEADQYMEPIVGQLITYDQDANDTHIYELIEGASNFIINGSELRILNPMPYNDVETNNFYTIVVRSTDSQSASKDETLRIEVVRVKDDEKPKILYFDQIPHHISDDSVSFKFHINATDNEKLDAAFFYYRPIRSTEDFIDLSDAINLTVIDEKLFQMDLVIETALMDKMGIEYYFLVRDAAENVASTDTAYTYWTYKDKEFEPTKKTYTGTVESYKIIANPFAIEPNKISTIFADYGNSTEDSWRLFGFENNNSKEIGIVPSSPLEQGHGYWFNKASELSQPIVFENAPTPENNKENPFTYHLEEGWNLIGNPYPLELNWDDVLLYNNLPIDGMELSTYDRGYKTPTHTLKEFEGGFVFADKAGELIFPIQKNVGSGNRIAHEKESGTGWQVKLSLDNGIIKNEMSGIGMNSNAVDSYDRYDRPLLPRFINHLDIAFNHPEHFAKAFSKDVVEIQENYIWEFVASNNFESNKVTISWDAHDITKSPNRLILYDILNDKIIDMKVTSKYTITLNEQAPFKALYGDEAFINDALAHIKTEALTPYPNPFNQLVSFPINLPYSTNKYNVECGIYNLMGEKVFERKIENIESGIFNLEWDEAQTETINQGIYIYSIKVTNGFLINNFHGRVLKN